MRRGQCTFRPDDKVDRHTNLSPVHTSNDNVVERYKLNDSFDSVECCFDIVAGVDGASYS